MLYCPRCNNTHWTPTGNTGVMSVLTLKKELECGKCGKIMMGSVFMKIGGTKDRRTNCPQCKTLAVRSRRTGMERLIPFLRAYRCQACKIRFHRLRSKE